MYRIGIGFLFTFFIAVAQLCAQSGGFNSPISSFGIGDIVDPNPIDLRHMGGINASFVDNYHINPVNPASYSYLRATAFDIGVSANNTNLSDGEGNSFRDWSGNLEYLLIGFPLRNPLNAVFDREKKDLDFGMGFSLQPVSRVAFHIANEDFDEQLGNLSREFIGDGGVFKAQWANSVKYKDFSFGVNIGYQFGTITFDRLVDFDSLLAFDNQSISEYVLRGFSYNVGAHYQLFLNEKEFTKDPNLSLIHI